MIKVREVVVWVALLAIYLNIGWGLGYYYHHNIDTQRFESASWHAKLLAGHCVFFAKDETAAKEVGKHNLFMARVVCSFGWPFVLALSAISWIGHFAFWIFKLIFWGGLIKLIFGIP